MCVCVIFVLILEVLKGILLNTENDYLKECKAQQKKIRGLLVAPSIMDDALEMIEEEGIEFVSIEPPRELKRDKKVTLDAF